MSQKVTNLLTINRSQLCQILLLLLTSSICRIESILVKPPTYLPAPSNLSVVLVQWYPPAVRVNWFFDSAIGATRTGTDRLRAFQIVFHPLRSRYRIIQEVPPSYRNLTLERLIPGVEYSLHVNTVTDKGDFNSSKVVHFVSPENDSRRFSRGSIGRVIHIDPEEENSLNVKPDEAFIVIVVLIAWVIVIMVFFNKWGKIRMLEPYQPQYRENDYECSVHSIHAKPSRMNTCTSANMPPHMQSTESHASLIAPERDILLHHARLSGSGHLYQCASGTPYHHPAYRPRLNSVFVESQPRKSSLLPDPSTHMPRKVKSAEDLKSMMVQVTHHDEPSTSTTAI